MAKKDTDVKFETVVDRDDGNKPVGVRVVRFEKQKRTWVEAATVQVKVVDPARTIPEHTDEAGELVEEQIFPKWVPPDQAVNYEPWTLEGDPAPPTKPPRVPTAIASNEPREGEDGEIGAGA